MRYIIVLTFFGVIANTKAFRLMEFSKCQIFLAELDMSNLDSINQVLHDTRLDMCLKIIDWIVINKSSFYQPQLGEENEKEEKVNVVSNEGVNTTSKEEIS